MTDEARTAEAARVRAALERERDELERLIYRPCPCSRTVPVPEVQAAQDVIDHLSRALSDAGLLAGSGDHATREQAAEALIEHLVPSPVEPAPAQMEMSGIFDWETLLGIADAVLGVASPTRDDLIRCLRRHVGARAETVADDLLAVSVSRNPYRAAVGSDIAPPTPGRNGCRCDAGLLQLGRFAEAVADCPIHRPMREAALQNYNDTTDAAPGHEDTRGCACPVNEAGDIRCHNCREYVNVRCWKCGTPRGQGKCLADAADGDNDKTEENPREEKP